MPSRTTLNDIAKAAGVSISTVDRVINSRGGVSAKSEAKVLEWARKMELDRVAFKAYLTPIRVAVLMQPPTNPFYSQIQAAITFLQPEIQSLRLHFFVHHIAPADEAATSNRVLEMAEKYDCLVTICPHSPGLLNAIRSISAKVPVFTFVTDLPDSGRIAYVGPNNLQMGRVAGELIGRFLGERGGGVLVLVGLSSFHGQHQRASGLRSVLESRFPHCPVLDVDETGEDQLRAVAIVNSMVQKHPEIRGIYCTSPGSREVAQVLQDRGLDQKTVLIAHEFSEVKRQLLLSGTIDAVIDQLPRAETARLVEVIAQHFSRSETNAVQSLYTPFDIVLRENCYE